MSVLCKCLHPFPLLHMSNISQLCNTSGHSIYTAAHLLCLCLFMAHCPLEANQLARNYSVRKVGSNRALDYMLAACDTCIM